MTSREWWVQVSLDALSDSLDQLETTEERGQWLEGFRVGSRGHSPRDDWSKFKRMGFDFGVGCHEEAVEFRAKKAGAGKASAEARKAKYGSASPNGVRSVFEHNSEHQPEHQLEQTTEQTTNQPTANSQQPTASNEQPASSSQGQAGRIPSNQWTPDSSHAGICDLRNLSMELQLERFRATANASAGSLDTPEGWNRRFMAWIARGRPEPVFSPATVMVSPTIQEWTDHAYQFASTHQPFKREDPDYFWPGELARAKWSAHQAAGWARIVDWKAQLEADCETWNGYERANRKRPAR